MKRTLLIASLLLATAAEARVGIKGLYIGQPQTEALAAMKKLGCENKPSVFPDVPTFFVRCTDKHIEHLTVRIAPYSKVVTSITAKMAIGMLPRVSDAAIPARIAEKYGSGKCDEYRNDCIWAREGVSISYHSHTIRDGEEVSNLFIDFSYTSPLSEKYDAEEKKATTAFYSDIGIE
jgi:hypothetical protein